MKFRLAIPAFVLILLYTVESVEIQCYLCDGPAGGPCDSPLNTTSSEVTTVPCNTSIHESACAFKRKELPGPKTIITRSCLGYCEDAGETCCTTNLCNSTTRPALDPITMTLLTISMLVIQLLS